VKDEESARVNNDSSFIVNEKGRVSRLKIESVTWIVAWVVLLYVPVDELNGAMKVTWMPKYGYLNAGDTN